MRFVRVAVALALMIPGLSMLSTGQQKSTTVPSTRDTSVVTVPKTSGSTQTQVRKRAVTQKPIAKKYTSKKVFHGKDKVDSAKKAASGKKPEKN